MSDEKKRSIIQEPTLDDALMLMVSFLKEEHRKEDEARGLWRNLPAEKSPS